MTQAEQISISLPRSLAEFIESYKIAKGCESDSQVIEVALKLLRRKAIYLRSKIARTLSQKTGDLSDPICVYLR